VDFVDKGQGTLNARKARKGLFGLSG